MYDFIDRPARLLNEGDRFLLWAMRGWQDARRRVTSPPLALRRGFASLGALPVLEEFHAVMSLLVASSPDDFESGIGAMDEPHITEAEAVLLNLWTRLADGEEEMAGNILALLVSEGLLAPMLAMMTLVVRHVRGPARPAIGAAPAATGGSPARPARSSHRRDRPSATAP